MLTMRAAIMDRFYVHHKNYIDSQVDIYDKHLSEEAVDESIAFYTSVAGEQIINKMPIINSEVDALSFELGRAILRDMMNIVDEYGDGDIENYDTSE